MTNGRGGSVHLLPKQGLRAEARALREKAHQLAGPGAAMLIADNFLVGLPWQPARFIAGYLPIHNEADVAPLLRQLADHGKDLLLPIVMGPDLPLEFRRWAPGDPLEPGPFNTLQPSDAAERAVPDLLLVPMLAYDESGGRLGYGGGYYDRSLAALRKRGKVSAVGIAYAAQKMKSLLREAHDQPLDWVVTEQSVWENEA
jgi:5-formyltetrahydrofolate cyclo-ligase